jgi:hypothetical protein
MKTMTADVNLIAACGLYCGACPKYLNETCPGCKQNAKATWCHPRTCCQEHRYRSCADCQDHPNVESCKSYDNLISKLFGLIFRSDRKGCLKMIQGQGYEAFARYMCENKLQSLKRK